MSIEYKVAHRPEEFEQIHRLNYKTFALEIPQHANNDSGVLVDKFHHENTYLIATECERVVAMMAVRGTRPFSLDEKIAELDRYLQPGRTYCELRLLAVEQEYRRAGVFSRLLAKTTEYCLRQGYDTALISGTTRQLRLYTHIGFTPFGPMVGSGEALYQPMQLTLERFNEAATSFLTPGLINPTNPLNLLPGPVSLHQSVKDVFSQDPVSHRSARFVSDIDRFRADLAGRVGLPHCAVLMGSGTVANDVIGAQIKAEGGHAVVAFNGEFGKRLAEQAKQHRIDYTELSFEHGTQIDPDAVERIIESSSASWLWFTHCETSTGVLNPLRHLIDLANRKGVKVCVDCISSFGTLPTDLRGARMASAVSGKGLAAYPGLAFVFSATDASPHKGAMPKYIDLASYTVGSGVPFTLSSNLFYAARTAFDLYDPEIRYQRIVSVFNKLYDVFEQCGFSIVAPRAVAAPTIITLRLPPQVSSLRFGEFWEERGVLLSYRSEYLVRNNYIQLCLFGEFDESRLLLLPGAMKKLSDSAYAFGVSQS